MSRGLRNNNPGNIRLSPVKYNGETVSEDKSFKSFETMAHGYRAIFVLLYTYQKKYGLNTLRKIIDRYAPPIENDTNSYANNVAKWAGIGLDDRIDTMNKSKMVVIVSAMSKVENGTPAVQKDVEDGWDLFIKIK